MNRPLTAVALILATAVAGCATPEGATDNRASGALLGAASGAALGNLIGGNSRGTLIGAATGAALGGLIGNQLDRQAAELRQGLEGSGAGVTNTGSQLVVNLPEAVTFDTGSALVQPGFRDELAVVAQNLLANPNSTIEVVGHTDTVGTAAYNQSLSERRARAVADVLIAGGVPAWRIGVRGMGFNQPVATNDTEAGRAANRRVEIVITPQTSA
jgi:outer membrane protein OmpA-like peptidoglycan-associated protein